MATFVYKNHIILQHIILLYADVILTIRDKSDSSFMAVTHFVVDGCHLFKKTCTSMKFSEMCNFLLISVNIVSFVMIFLTFTLP